MKQAFTFIAVALLTILTSCENNKKQCYQFTTKVAGQTVTTYENCTKAVAEATVKQLKANGATSASYKVADASKCSNTSTTTPSTTTTTTTTPTEDCWCVSWYWKMSPGHYLYKRETFFKKTDAQSFYNSKKTQKNAESVTMDKCYCD